MSRPLSNSYSPQWFDFFHLGIAEGRTSKEVDFICAVAPLPKFRRALDVCCGAGRHARALAALGYCVTGIERDAAAIGKARDLGGGPEYVEADVRDYRPKKAAYDLAIIMSQSFGHFDAATNRDLLGRLASGLRPGGRVILDLWNPEFFVGHQGKRDLEMAAGIVRERKRVKGDQLFVDLTYPDGTQETFEWQLFTAEEMRSLGELVGLALVNAGTDFDTARKPNAENPRIQFVLQKP